VFTYSPIEKSELRLGFRVYVWLRVKVRVKGIGLRVKGLGFRI
jgi:hypothetical protein